MHLRKTGNLCWFSDCYCCECSKIQEKIAPPTDLSYGPTQQPVFSLKLKVYIF